MEKNHFYGIRELHPLEYFHEDYEKVKIISSFHNCLSVILDLEIDLCFGLFNDLPLHKDCTTMLAFRIAINRFRAWWVLTRRWMVFAALLRTSALLASNSAIWPALKNTFVLPIWRLHVQQSDSSYGLDKQASRICMMTWLYIIKAWITCWKILLNQLKQDLTWEHQFLHLVDCNS